MRFYVLAFTATRKRGLGKLSSFNNGKSIRIHKSKNYWCLMLFIKLELTVDQEFCECRQDLWNLPFYAFCDI